MTVDGRMVSPDEAERLPREQLLNEEQPIHPLYAYLYVVDRYEGLIVVNAATLLDGDPLNNYLKRELDESRYPNSAFNPDGALTGANNITLAGTNAYITTERELVVVSIDDPLNPKIATRIAFKHPRAIAIQFRYGFVVDDDGLKTVELSAPGQVRFDGVYLPLADARDVYVARTYAYVAQGKSGIAIVNITQPNNPSLDQTYNAGGALNDTRQIKIAMTNASLFAYVADGKNGLRILQLTSPETMPTYAGFSPRPQPQLIATFKTKGEALGVSKALDRDRAVDESGNQVAVFGRRGARPFTHDEVQRMMRTNGGKGDYFSVSDDPTTEPLSLKSENRPASDAIIGAVIGVLMAAAVFRKRRVTRGKR
jgi:LVIVD repeat-containing protein